METPNIEVPKERTIFDKMSPEEQAQVITDAPKYWEGLSPELKKQFTEIAFKGATPESLTKSQIEGLFILDRDYTETLPLDVRYLEEHTKYMQDNGWWL